jgi:hypothetical protein
MIRSLPFLAGLLVAAAPAAASTYSATLAAPTSARFIGRDIVWSCRGSACQGATDESRPLVLCQSLAKRAGRIDSFLVDGRALAPAELHGCNGSAKAQAPTSLAGK